MDKESELQRLEKYVEKILVRFSALKAEKEQLERDLSERNQLIEELRGNISNKETERSEISERVNKIVDQIEEWELNLDIEAEEGATETAEGGEQPGEHNENQEMEEVLDEEERHVQHELFSMTSSEE